jgi:hypothetical protein
MDVEMKAPLAVRLSYAYTAGLRKQSAIVCAAASSLFNDRAKSRSKLGNSTLERAWRRNDDEAIVMQLVGSVGNLGGGRLKAVCVILAVVDESLCQSHRKHPLRCRDDETTFSLWIHTSIAYFTDTMDARNVGLEASIQPAGAR